MKFIKIIIVLLSMMAFQMSYAADENINLKTAKALLKWNSKNLVSSADLKKFEINQFFATDFVVDANGIRHQANFDNYFQFLNKFRQNIKTIDYEMEDFIVDRHHVVIPLKAHIQLNNKTRQVFDAILILKFNKEHKIVLWREVYHEVLP